MYVGNPWNTISLDDVWVLSMPSSRWIRVNDVNNHERMSDGPEAGCDGHTFGIWRESQLLVLGSFYAYPATQTTLAVIARPAFVIPLARL